jgi:hypothetical protein
MYFPEIIPGHNSPQMKDREIIAFTQVSANDDTQDNVELEVGEELEALQQEDDHIIVPTSSRCSRRRGFFAVILLSVLIFLPASLCCECACECIEVNVDFSVFG